MRIMRYWRINLIFILIILFGAAIIGRLFYIQIINHNFYLALAQGQQKDFLLLKGNRGDVFFSGGEILATNIEETFRRYPQESMASQVIGFLGGEGVGQYGIEGYYDKTLQDSDIFLTLDYNIQFMAEKLLGEAGKDLGIEAGQIIVTEPATGRILALADFPSYNPNSYYKVEDFKIFQNSAIQKIFEPGSIFKPITMAVALDQGKVNPQTTFFDSGQIKIGKDIISNYDGRFFGEQTMTQVLEKSINTGAVFAEEQIGHAVFLDYLSRFGFFEPTGIDLQGEISSENKELKKGYEVNFATASFGQGIEVTPIQLVRAFCAIANGGKLIKPYTSEKELGSFSPDQVISSKTASQLTAMLVSVVEQGPYTKRAKIPGYYIAGKTGTAQVPEAGVYSTEKTIQSFVGFAPAFNPRFLILVKLDNPKTKTAEYSAVPMFQELAKYIIDYWQIPPDYE